MGDRLFTFLRQQGTLVVLSGGQTGADQIGLRVASRLGIPSFSIMPRGRRTEVTDHDWAGADDFAAAQVIELDSDSYRHRTWLNAFLGDATLLWDYRAHSDGSAETRRACDHLGRPYLSVPTLPKDERVRNALEWLDEHDVRVLNIAGNRGSLLSEVQAAGTESELEAILRALKVRLDQRESDSVDGR